MPKPRFFRRFIRIIPLEFGMRLGALAGRFSESWGVTISCALLSAHGASLVGRPNWISSRAFLDLGWSGAVEIHDRVVVSHFVRILTHDFSLGTWGRRGGSLDPNDKLLIKGRVVLDDDCFVGMGAIILPGVHVGAGAVVAAGSVVSGDVPPDVVVAGVPARVIGSTEERFLRVQARAEIVRR